MVKVSFDIGSFVPRHGKLVCFDSDGTVIDAMNVKHRRCHGAAFIAEWGLDAHAEEVQRVWDSINLYEPTRGVNRFIALAEMLRRMGALGLVGTPPAELGALEGFVARGKLSNAALKAEIEARPSPLLEKALRWSLALNERIAALTPADKPPFPGTKEALEYAHGLMDVAVVSSSNMSAILEEWAAWGLGGYAGVVTSQEVGTKGECLLRMLEKGYAPEDVLMVGDAWPDVDAAREAGVWYYPILTRREGESWRELRGTYLDEFLAGRYGEHQAALLDKFESNFAKQGE